MYAERPLQAFPTLFREGNGLSDVSWPHSGTVDGIMFAKAKIQQKQRGGSDSLVLTWSSKHAGLVSETSSVFFRFVGRGAFFYISLFQPQSPIALPREVDGEKR